MRESVESHDIEARLPEILRRMEAGEAFTIMSRGKPIADLTPRPQRDERKMEAAIKAILSADRPVVSDEKLKEYIAEGRM